MYPDVRLVLPRDLDQNANQHALHCYNPHGGFNQYNFNHNFCSLAEVACIFDNQ